MKVQQILGEAAFSVDDKVNKLMAKLDKVLMKPEWDYIDDMIDAVALLNKSFKKEKVEFLPNERNTKVSDPLWLRAGLVSGDYDPSKDKITVYVSHNIHKILQDLDRREDFKSAISTLFKHEFVHKEQAARAHKAIKSRGLDPADQTVFGKPSEVTTKNSNKAWKTYLSNPQEIGAMAHEIVDELLNKVVSKGEIFDALKTGDTRILNRSARYVNFKDFVGDNRLVMNRLYKNIAQIVTQ